MWFLICLFPIGPTFWLKLVKFHFQHSMLNCFWKSSFQFRVFKHNSLLKSKSVQTTQHDITSRKQTQNLNTNSYYTRTSSMCTTPICVTCSWYTLGGKPLVSGSAIMEFVLMCSIDTWRLWTLSFTTKNLMSMCLDFDEL